MLPQSKGKWQEFRRAAQAALYTDRKSLYRGAQPNQASPKCSEPVKRKSPSPGLTRHCRSVRRRPRQEAPAGMGSNT